MPPIGVGFYRKEIISSEKGLSLDQIAVAHLESSREENPQESDYQYIILPIGHLVSMYIANLEKKNGVGTHIVCVDAYQNPQCRLHTKEIRYKWKSSISPCRRWLVLSIVDMKQSRSDDGSDSDSDEKKDDTAPGRMFIFDLKNPLAPLKKYELGGYGAAFHKGSEGWDTVVGQSGRKQSELFVCVPGEQEAIRFWYLHGRWRRKPA